MKKLQHPTAELAAAAKAACPYEWCDHAACTPTDVEPIRSYAFTLEYCHEGRDGYVWAGHIWQHGTKVLHVQNDGNGGPNWYTPLVADDRKSHADYLAAAVAAYPTLDFEQDDALTSFLDLISGD